MHSKGNVVAMAITAIIITAAAAAFIVTFYGTPAPELPMSTALSETEISVSKAIALGISEWTETGFDQNEAMWYNNRNRPPSLEAAKQSLKETVKEEITKVLEELRTQRGYTFEFDDPAVGPVIEFDFKDITQMDELNKESVTVKVSGFKIKDEKGSIVTVKEFETEEKFNYPVWEIYSKMYEWSSEDMNNFYLHLEDIFDSKPFQFRFCDCGIIDKVEREEQITTAKITWEEIEELVLKPALDSLSKKFASNPNIVCSYTVEDKAVENIPNILKRGAAGCNICDIDGGGESFDMPADYDTIFCWETDELGRPDAYCDVQDTPEREDVQPTRTPGSETTFMTLCEGEDFSGADQRCTTLDATECNNPIFNATQRTLCEQGKVCYYGDEECRQSFGSNPFLDVGATHEVVGMTKRVAGLLRFECKDVQSRVGTEEEFKELTAKVVVRFALLKGSPPPKFCTTEAGPICKYGALVTLIGIECTPWDPCFLDAGDEAACGICECMNTRQIIHPIAENGGLTWFQQHEAGSLNIPDAVSWCKTQGGAFYCPAKVEASDITAECDTFQQQAIANKQSLDCILYTCDVEGDTVKRGCNSFTANFPTPCGDKLCSSCSTDPARLGFCEGDQAKDGQTCGYDRKLLPSGMSEASGYSPWCFACNYDSETKTSECVARENAEQQACSWSRQCKTYCSDQGQCNVIKEADKGQPCRVIPTGVFTTQHCDECRVSGEKLVCDSVCQYGCCENPNAVWARCMNQDKKCCSTNPEPTLDKCPGET